MPAIINSDDGVLSGSSGLKTSGANDGITAFQQNGTESARITAAGNVGVGTSSPGQKLEVSNSSTNTTFSTVGNQLLIRNSGSTVNAFARIDFTGSTNNPMASIAAQFENYGTGATSIIFGNTNTGTGSITERARIDSSGNLLVGAAAQVSAEKFLTFQNVGGQNVIHARLGSSASACTGFLTSNATGASSFDYFGAYNGSGTKMAGIVSTGTFQSATNTYGGTSDERLKENIVDATPKLGDLLKVKVRNFNFKSDVTKLKQIGVVAQELETVFPGLVEETPTWDMEGNDTGTVKLVKYSVFVPMLIKAIQEQQAIIQSLTARIEALERK